MTSKKRWIALAIVAVVFVGIGTDAELAPFGGNAWAVIGRPLTPLSYAGVARRTTRRAVRRSYYYGGGGAYYGGAITALPPGCGFAIGIYTCGATRYRPYYDGPTVVYQVVH